MRPETRERVLAAMRELGYRPNSIARALVTGRSRTLGVVSFDTTLYGPASTLFGIERAAHEAGYFIIIASLKALDRTSVTEAIERLQLHGVDGILVIVSDLEAADALLHASADVPLVAVEAGPERGVPVVAVDQFAGAAAGHPSSARSRARERVAHRRARGLAGGPERVAGWRAALQAAGAAAPAPLVGDWSARVGLRPRPPPEPRPPSRPCSSPTTRWRSGCCGRCTRPGRAIPDDVSVVGFDDIPEAPYFTPPLTTVRQDFGEVGSRSLRVLVQTVEAFKAGEPPLPRRARSSSRPSWSVRRQHRDADRPIGSAARAGLGERLTRTPCDR